MVLSRSTFEDMFQNIKTAIMQYSLSNAKGRKDVKQQAKASELRCLTTQRFPNPTVYIGSVTRFMRDSLYFSLYGRLYRDLLLHPAKAHEIGDTSSLLTDSETTRAQAVASLRSCCMGILKKDPLNRSASDHRLVISLLRQKNELFNELCKDWVSYQYSDLCRKVRLLHVERLHQVGNGSTSNHTRVYRY